MRVLWLDPRVADQLTLLAHAARGGDARALDAFVAASYQDVWRLCAALVDHQAADDLVQETFLRITTALRGFRGDAAARTWVLAIARRVCIDELRARTKQRGRDAALAVDRGTPAPAPDGDLAVRDLLLHLDVDRRTAFVLTQLFRLSYDEAARICECPTGTIRSRVARARDDLIRLTSDTPTTQRVSQPEHP